MSLLLAGCSGKAATSPSKVNMTVTGKVTGISSEYGNAYTSIGPDRYDELNLSAGETVFTADPGDLARHGHVDVRRRGCRLSR
ncbi:MAG: hypothetical protein AAF743_16075, partial [Planctomycetota bacterium]